jgi:succinyl-diaminopimelate desuccinylase
MDSTNANLIKILEDLIEFNTEAYNYDGKKDCISYIEEQLKKYPLVIERYISHGFPSLVASTGGKKHIRILLQAHLDVVPGKPELFKMREKNGRLVGRGTYDMKFAAACFLQLIEELDEELENLDIGFMFTTDEEVGGYDGVGYLLKEQGYTCDVCLIPDGGNDWQIESRCNDIWLAELKAQGLTAHGSRPWEGENAINNLMEGLIEIHRLFGRQRAGKNSLTISKIEGGYAENQVPDSAKATLDMRFIDEKQFAIYKKAIELIASEHGLKLINHHTFSGARVELTHPEIQKFLKVAKKVHGSPIKHVQSLGSSDAHFFAEIGIPTIVIRPEGGAAHSDEEWIDKLSLLKYYELLKLYVLEAASVADNSAELDSEKVAV